MWVIPPEQNADFVCQMEQVLDVYQRPYNPEQPVICLDESPKQLVRETRTPVTCRMAVHAMTMNISARAQRRSICAVSLWQAAAVSQWWIRMIVDSGPR